MNKNIFCALACGLILLSAPVSALAAAGKVTPIDWGRKVDLNDLGGPMPTVEESTTAPPMVVTGFAVYGSATRYDAPLQVVRADGTVVGMSKNMELRDGDRIETSGSAAAVIEFADGSSLKLGTSTSITIGSANPLDFTVKLVWGELWVKLLKTKLEMRRKFEIRTSGGAGAIRGTELLARYVPESQETSFFLYEGLLDASNLKGETKNLQPGDSVVIAGDGTMTMGKMGETQWAEMTQKIDAAIDAAPAAEPPTAPETESTKKTRNWSAFWPILTVIIVAGAATARRRRNQPPKP